MAGATTEELGETNGIKAIVRLLDVGGKSPEPLEAEAAAGGGGGRGREGEAPETDEDFDVIGAAIAAAVVIGVVGSGGGGDGGSSRDIVGMGDVGHVTGGRRSVRRMPSVPSALRDSR